MFEHKIQTFIFLCFKHLEKKVKINIFHVKNNSLSKNCWVNKLLTTSFVI